MSTEYLYYLEESLNEGLDNLEKRPRERVRKLEEDQDNLKERLSKAEERMSKLAEWVKSRKQSEKAA